MIEVTIELNPTKEFRGKYCVPKRSELAWQAHAKHSIKRSKASWNNRNHK